MMAARIVKDPEERRDEIVAAAAKLFLAKGYEHCTINDILDAVGIAKGTFYYHFPSKEALLEEFVLRTVEGGIEAAKAIAAHPDLDPLQKLMAAIDAQNHSTEISDLVLDHMHRPGNERLHLLSLVRLIEGLSPVLEQIVIEGNAAGTFDAPHPRIAVEILLTTAGFLFDDGYFDGSLNDPERLIAAVAVYERILGTAPGAIAALMGSGPAN